MGRSPCYSKVGLNKGAWTAAEDRILTDYIKLHGEGRWTNLPKRAGELSQTFMCLKRCGKSCRLRWLNYLRPDIKRGNISFDEEDLIIRLHKLLGNRWSLIAGRLPGRTDNEIKNYWNTTIAKKANDLRNLTSTSMQPNQPTKRDKEKTQSHDINETNVVMRTKARRCSRFYCSPQQQKTEPTDRNPRPGTVLIEDSSISNPIELGPHHRTSSSTVEEDGMLSFLMDATVGELCLTEMMMNSEFSDLFGYIKNSDLSPSSQAPITLPDEMLENWTEGYYGQSNLGFHNNFLASIPESEVDLLAE
ncbi:hypothetical protein RJ640_013009 [Escallonia rubra]|uniref:Myb-related protein 123 n=1 Tax=Escallonia rubra TaxID=112253 RepID=A0AA88QTF6_9ASTE|nr:hypothetical protein RJ640_013009 [Escallonia rubra]